MRGVAGERYGRSLPAGPEQPLAVNDRRPQTRRSPDTPGDSPCFPEVRGESSSSATTNGRRSDSNRTLTCSDSAQVGPRYALGTHDVGALPGVGRLRRGWMQGYQEFTSGPVTSSDGLRRKYVLNANMLAGTVMFHGIPPSSKIGTEKCGQKYAIAKSGVIDAFTRSTRLVTRSGPFPSKALAANNVDRLRKMYASPSMST